MRRRLTLLVAPTVAALCLAGVARAGGGNYVFDGGTLAEQAQVRAALEASSFDWSLVPVRITLHIVRDIPSSQASPGQIWLDAGLLDSGEFSWAFVQHEYGHQVDFFLLDDAKRAALEQALGAEVWFYDEPLPHAAYGCERFASTLAWAYWQSPDNCMKPLQVGGESGAMQPAAFRSLLSSVLGQAAASASATPDTASPAHAPAVRQTASATKLWIKTDGKWHAVKLSSLK